VAGGRSTVLPPLALVGVVGLLVAGTAAATAAGLPALAGVGTGRPVTVIGATAVCPDLRQGVGLTTRVSAGSAATSTEGSIQTQRLSPSGPRLRRAAVRPGQVSAGFGGDVSRDGMVVTARGPLAGGLEVEQLTRGDRAADWGFAGLRCGPPSSEAWFVGGGAAAGERALLVLANSDDAPALVDVAVFSSTGAQDPRRGAGLAVAPHSRTFVQLDTLAAGKDLLAVHVRTRRGRLAAALRYTRYDGQVPGGVEWVPQSQPPATTVVVPGVPVGPGYRYALITNPGPDDTTVSVQVTTSDGQFLPTGLEAVRVAAGHTVRERLDALTDTSGLALRVVSSGGPVLAGGYVLDTSDTGPVSEISYTAGSAPLSGPALLTDVDLDESRQETLLLSTLGAAPASVLLRPVAISGSTTRLPGASTVRVPAGRTITVDLVSLIVGATQGRFALEVVPAAGSAPVYAARYLRESGPDGPLTTLLDLQSPAQQVLRPAVVRDPGAAG